MQQQQLRFVTPHTEFEWEVPIEVLVILGPDIAAIEHAIAELAVKAKRIAEEFEAE